MLGGMLAVWLPSLSHSSLSVVVMMFTDFIPPSSKAIDQIIINTAHNAADILA